MTQADQSRVGQVIGGKYHLLRLVSTGGMGIVYEARHTLVNRRLAVKFLRRELVARRENLKRFHREAQAAGALESENITTTMDFGIAKDRSPYIVMEFLVGENLKALLNRLGRLPVERAADLVRQACRGVHVAHTAGIVHRDLNPQNLWVCRREDGTDLLKVLDFGIAKLDTDAPCHTQTRTGTALGTPAYMSPEQARGEKAIDRRVDVYALGAILYELLSGKKPHPGASYNAVLHHIATQPAIPFDADLDVPPDLAAVVERALSRDPTERFPTAKALGNELAPWARRSVWPAVKPDKEEPPPPQLPSEISLQSVARAPQPSASWSRGRWIWVAGAAGMLAVGLGVAWRQHFASALEREQGAPERSPGVRERDTHGAKAESTATTPVVEPVALDAGTAPSPEPSAPATHSRSAPKATPRPPSPQLGTGRAGARPLSTELTENANGKIPTFFDEDDQYE